jgi:hypothetical protein
MWLFGRDSPASKTEGAKMADKVIRSKDDISGAILPEGFEWKNGTDFEMREFEAETERAFSKKLKTPLKFKAYYAAFKNYDAVVKAGKTPNPDAIVKMMNAQQKATARAAFTAANLKAAGYKAPDENDPQNLLRGMIDTILKARKITSPTPAQQQEARAAAEAATGIKWEEVSDELLPVAEGEEAEEAVEA